MKVILLDNVAKTGQRYEVVDIANGYAMNFLIPKKLARTATPEALKELESERMEAEKKRAIQLQSLTEALEKVHGKTIVLKGKANEEGHLFAGIHKDTIVEAIKTELGASIDADVLSCAFPIKEIGEHTITISGPQDETAQITLVGEKEGHE